MRAAVAAAVALLLVGLLGDGLGAGAAWADKGVVERDKVDVSPAKGITIDKVAIDNRFGDVTVKGHDSPGITIIAVKRAPDEETLDRLKVSLVPDPAGPVSINTALLATDEARPIAAGSIKIDLLVYVPRSARIDATTWTGAVALQDLDNGAVITTNEGDIEVKNCAGAIETHAAQGTQVFFEIFGDLEAEGISGAMTMKVVKGERLGARMHDGTIVAHNVRAREVNLRTTSGDIDFDGEAVTGGSIHIASYSGNVRVSFRAGASLRVEAFSKRGTIATSGMALTRKGKRAFGSYGGGKNPAGVYMKTNLGNIRFGLVDEDAL